ncbi:MAG: sensor histidine kinase [Mangrovibacterium sp.]
MKVMAYPSDSDLNNFVSMRISPHEKIELHDEIINSIALELRNPVTILKSNVQFLKSYCLKTDDLFIEESFTLCEYALNDILRFFDCVGFLSDSCQGVLRLQKSHFDLNIFLKQVFDEIVKLNYNASRIHVDLQACSLFINTDKYLLYRILINLLINALKFSHSPVELVVSEANEKLNIVIRDQGIGIPPDEIMNIFKPFARAANAKMIPGTGLGLSIVSRAIDFLEGTLYVKSAPDKGTEFNVILPLAFAGPVSETKRSVVLKRKQYC